MEVSYEGTTCLTLPVSYSGYVNSNDDVAVAEAYKNGSIRPALIKEKKSYWKYIIAAVVVACILGLFIYANVIEPRNGSKTPVPADDNRKPCTTKRGTSTMEESKENFKKIKSCQSDDAGLFQQILPVTIGGYPESQNTDF